ncbi:ABC transporter ATP-binding protein [Tropicibacter oceani]|uniref:ABC transporter ATP-binding protein n=1 Tax=Tropicibacter oceani TaxID=3058420 RepID=A0ABY8QIU6_9RHOB|nr:ABC transporter ATP-binding protein [Tropicibacter oceani]WGW03717.1 ABC transporter ATP-binding protein [Tropicibacter oceani]
MSKKRKADRHKTPEVSPEAARGLALWLWKGYLKKYTGLMAIAMVFMAIEGAMFGMLSYMMKPMFDDVFVGGNADALVWVAFAVMAIFLARAFSGVIQKVLLTRVSQLSMGDLRQDMLEHIMVLDTGFHQSNGPGLLMHRVEGDVSAISKIWSTLITGAGRDVVALISLFWVALLIDWRWTLVALIGVPLLVVPSIFLQRFVRGNSRHVRNVTAGMSSHLNEVFHGITPVKLNTLERYQAKRYATLTKARVRSETRAAVGKAALPGLIDVMSGIGFVGVLLYGGSEILSGAKTVGDFMAFFTAIGLAFEPLRRLGAFSGAWQQAAASIERIKELMQTSPTLKDPAHPVPAPQGVPRIELRDVHLSFGDAPALRGVSLIAEPGQTTALVGASGAGKSTIFNLLTRLLDSDQGDVLIGGVATRDMELRALRRMFSVVSQDSLLFDETLRENVVLGRDVDEQALQKALEAAHVTDFLPRLENGLDTPVGPRGSNLSGGQRQRVAIARALLRDTPILLLDEATSALDAQSEAVVQSALERLSEGRTTLVIAHRLATIRNADKIVVMHQGRVVDQGTHDELIARDGPYQDLYHLQFDHG